MSAQKMDGAPALGDVATVDTPCGVITYFPFDKPIGEGLEIYGEWAGRELAFLSQFIGPGDVVIDAGAHIGNHTLHFAERVGPKGRVHAFEASPEVGRLLRHNVESNNLTQVTPHCIAVGAARASATIPRLDPGRLQNAGAEVVTPIGEIPGRAGFQLPTEIMPLDELDLDRLDFIKLDIEGFEFDALRGADRLITTYRPIIYVEMLSVDIGVLTTSYLVARGYKPYFCACDAYSADNPRKNKNNIFGFAREASLLFIADEARLPGSAPGVSLTAVRSYEGLAQAFFEMPRYGDLTNHDRIARRIVKDREKLKAEIAPLTASAERIRQLEDWSSQQELLAARMEQTEIMWAATSAAQEEALVAARRKAKKHQARADLLVRQLTEDLASARDEIARLKR